MARAPTQDRSKARVERILAAASLMLAESEEAITARALAARSGVALGTIYQFFVDMKAVREAVGGRARALLIEALDAHVPATLARDPKAYLARLIVAVDKLQEAHPEIGCMVREKPPGSFPEQLGGDLQAVARARMGEAFRSEYPHLDRVELDRILDIASTALLAVLSRLPARGTPDRATYIQDALLLVSGYLAGRLRPRPSK